MASTLFSSSLKPILKWAGGKEKELKYIIPNAPEFERYIEQFVGGGAVFAGICAKQNFINDKSDELICLYRNISENDNRFFCYAEGIDASWENAETFFRRHTELIETYYSYREGKIGMEDLKEYISNFCEQNAQEIKQIIGEDFSAGYGVLIDEFRINLQRKLMRMRELEKQKHILPDSDVEDNVQTAIKSALYMCYRWLYNDKQITTRDSAMHSALFLFIRNYAYSGMFRYNDKGEFNVPYGGIGYNSKTMKSKLAYYQSEDLQELFNRTQIYNLDFEDFLQTVTPTEKDFVFLDPPYDSEFSTYAQNEFSKGDQQRLADYMINKCKSKWMLIIKHTDFIYSLYDKPGINIRTFDKEYLVSFMNRNNKKTTHLLITNY